LEIICLECIYESEVKQIDWAHHINESGISSTSKVDIPARRAERGIFPINRLYIFTESSFAKRYLMTGFSQATPFTMKSI